MPNLVTLASVDTPRASQPGARQSLDGRPFTAVLLEDGSKRASALSLLLSTLQLPSVRVVRMGSSVRSRLTLEHILLQVTAPDGNPSLADNARLIARTIAERRDQETSVVLLITQAETLHSRTLRLLQDMAPYFAADPAPTLQVVFVGRPAFQDLLQGRDLTPLREALGFPAHARPLEPLMDDDVLMPEDAAELPNLAQLAPPVELIAGRLVPPPASAVQRGNRTVRSLLLVAMITIGIGTGYLAARGLFYGGLFHQSPPTPPTLSAAPATKMQPASSAPPPATATLPAPMPDVLRPALAPVVSSPALTPRPALPQQPSLNDSALVNPTAMPNPRVVIHTPVGSETSAALSAQLLANLGSRLGTVELRRVPETPIRPSIRYFHPDDEPIARQVAARMADTGLPWAIRDFSTFLPRPSRGTIEIWLPRL